MNNNQTKWSSKSMGAFKSELRFYLFIFFVLFGFHPDAGGVVAIRSHIIFHIDATAFDAAQGFAALIQLTNSLFPF